MPHSNHPITLSVIVPIHNSQPYLTECLASLASQDIEGVEFLLLDDGSTDGSLAEMQQIANTDARFKAFSFPNTGVGATRNRGINLAVGKYVAFMDPDDLYANSHTLSDLVQAAEKNQVNICGGSAAMLHCLPETEPWLEEDIQGSYAPMRFTASGIQTYESYQHDSGFWRFIYNREFLIANKLYFPHLPRYQDPPFFCKAMAVAGKFYATSDVVYIYRKFGGKDPEWWTTERLLSILEGTRLMLEIAAEYHLTYLQKLAWFRITVELRRVLQRSVSGGDTKVARELISLAKYAPLGREIDILSILSPLPENLDSMVSALLTPDDLIPPREVSDQPPHTTSDNPLVSVIIPVYNSEIWINEAVMSAISQTDISIEIILVNDGSTDNSAWYLNRYASLFSNVRVITRPNGGLSAARNTGLDAAIGKYVVFLDADDFWGRRDLHQLVAMMEKDNLDVLFFGMRRFYDDEESKTFQGQPPRIVPTQPAQLGVKLLAATMAVGDYRESACGYLVRRQFLVDNQISFIPGLMHEDDVFTYQVFSKSARAAIIDVPFYRRRVRGSSIMTEANSYKSAIGKGIAYLTIQHDLPSIPDEYREPIKSHAESIWGNSSRSQAKLSEQQQRDVNLIFESYGGFLDRGAPVGDFRVDSAVSSNPSYADLA